MKIKVDLEKQKVEKELEHQDSMLNIEKEKVEMERKRLEAELEGNSPVVQAEKLQFARSALEKGKSFEEIESFIDRILKKK